MERVSLVAEPRMPGKGPAKRARIGGRIPAVLYGRTVKPIAISVGSRELEAAVKTKAGMNVLIDISVTGGNSGLALIRDYQADPFKRIFQHVDFQAISLTDRLEVEVPIVLVGESEGVKEGGIIEQLKRTINIRALPEKIPERIEVDITKLKIGASLHLNDINLPDGAEWAQTFNYTIVAIVPPAKEEVAVPVTTAAEVPVEGAAAPVEGAPAEAAAAVPAAKGAEEKKEKEGKAK